MFPVFDVFFDPVFHEKCLERMLFNSSYGTFWQIGGGGAHPKKTKKNQSLHQNR